MPSKGETVFSLTTLQEHADQSLILPTKQDTEIVHTVERDNEDFDSELFVDAVKTESKDDESAYADIRLGLENKKLTFKLDTRAQTRYLQQTLPHSCPAHHL